MIIIIIIKHVSHTERKDYFFLCTKNEYSTVCHMAADWLRKFFNLININNFNLTRICSITAWLKFIVRIK